MSDEIPFDIPDSWEWVRLGNIGDWGAGATPSRTHPEYYGGNIPWLKTGDLTDSYIDAIPETITELALEKTSVRLNPAGSVLIAMYGATIGKLGILSIAATTNQACCACFPLGGLDNKYLFYFLMAQKPLFIKQGEGGAQPNISKEKIVSTLMPVPPLEEQKRIVVMLGRIFPIIDAYSKCKTELDLYNTTFPERLKKSILQEAVKGKLVPQDPSDEPAEALLERIRAEKQRLIKEGKIKKDKHESVIFRRDNSHYEKRGSEEVCIDEEIPFEIPSGWSWSRLGTCLDVRDGTHDTPRYVSEGVPLVTSKNLSNGRIDFSTAKLISKQDSVAINQRSKVDSGDIMYAMIGSIGNPVLYRGADEFSIKNMALFKCVPDGMYMEYVYWFLVLAQEDMKKAASGGVQSFVSLGYLRNYLIPVPPIVEQKRICYAIEQVLPLLAAL